MVLHPADDRADAVTLTRDEIAARFQTEVGDPLNAEWKLTDPAAAKSVVLLVSKESHCLIDLLGRAHRGELPATISAVVGNHADLAELTERFGIPFHHVPFTAERKGTVVRAGREHRRQLPPGRGGPGPVHADPAAHPVRRGRAGRSTSTTASCPASSAPAPTIRRSRGASN